jgi:hypothetical protein
LTKTTNYLERATSFPTRNFRRLALRMAPMALIAVAAAYATPSFNGPNSTSAQTNPSYLDFDDNNCPSSGNLSGAATNGGLGVTFSGNASITGFGASAQCVIGMVWVGGGSGTFNGTTATVASNFTITAPADVVVNSWTLTVFINGSQVSTYGCTASLPPGFRALALRSNTGQPTSCSGNYPTSPQSFTVPASLSSYKVQLYVYATWTDTGTTTLTVSVPGSTSIDILAQGASAVPALSPLAFIMTGILLLSLAGFGILRRTSTGSGFPGQPS